MTTVACWQQSVAQADATKTRSEHETQDLIRGKLGLGVETVAADYFLGHMRSHLFLAGENLATFFTLYTSISYKANNNIFKQIIPALQINVCI